MARSGIQELSAEQLAQLHDEQQMELQRLLLNGTAWQKTHILRQRITHIAATLYRKLNPEPFAEGEPAGTAGRKSKTGTRS